MTVAAESQLTVPAIPPPDRSSSTGRPHLHVSGTWTEPPAVCGAARRSARAIRFPRPRNPPTGTKVPSRGRYHRFTRSPEVPYPADACLGARTDVYVPSHNPVPRLITGARRVAAGFIPLPQCRPFHGYCDRPPPPPNPSTHRQQRRRVPDAECSGIYWACELHGPSRRPTPPPPVPRARI